MKGKIFRFDEHDTFLFGRARDCHARLPQDDTTVSRHHFILETNPPDVKVRDLGSLNGTFINGRKYGGRPQGKAPDQTQKTKLPTISLKNLDKIAVGETIFLVKIETPVFCCRCRKEIPREFKLLCRWIEGTLICPSCRKQVEKSAKHASDVHVEYCANCGKDVGDEVPEGRPGDYLCEECQAKGQTNPAAVLVQLLMQQREEGEEEASLSNVAGYRINRLLGKGTLGGAYLATSRESERSVVLKILLSKVPVDDRSRDRFLREMEILESLKHSNILEIYSHGSAGSGFFFAMEYCEGGNFADLVRKTGGKLPVEEASDLMLQCLEGLAYAHEHGVVHRNLKPSNILLTADHRVKISETGLSRSLEKAGFSGMVATDSVLHAPEYMPRERLIQFRSANPASDVWSAAAVFYYLLTGRAPREFPEHKDPIEVILTRRSTPIRRVDPEIPKKLAKVMDHALDDSVKKRYPTAVEFRNALKKAIA